VTFDLTSLQFNTIIPGYFDFGSFATNEIALSPFSAGVGDHIVFSFTFLPGQTLLIGNLDDPTQESLGLGFNAVPDFSSGGEGVLTLNVVGGYPRSEQFFSYTNTSNGITSSAVDLTSSFVEISGGQFDFRINNGIGRGTFGSAYLFSVGSGITVNSVTVPEPETCGMMLAGLGLIGVIARRRRSIA
jgi:hypothetical protein